MQIALDVAENWELGLCKSSNLICQEKLYLISLPYTVTLKLRIHSGIWREFIYIITESYPTTFILAKYCDSMTFEVNPLVSSRLQVSEGDLKYTYFVL